MLTRSVFFFASFGLLAMILWAFGEAPFWASFSLIVNNPWGLVTLVDLYLGFAVISALLIAVEGFSVRAILWIVALLCLGNVVSAFWIAFRGYRFLELMRRMSVESPPIALK